MAADELDRRLGAEAEGRRSNTAGARSGERHPAPEQWPQLSDAARACADVYAGSTPEYDLGPRPR